MLRSAEKVTVQLRMSIPDTSPATTAPALPPEVADRSAWYEAKLAKSDEWIVRLSDAEIAEVERAIQSIERSGVELTTITAANIPLPTLRPRLDELLDEVLNGRGFVLIKGLPVHRWSRREAAVAFLAIGVHLGNLRMQNAAGHLLGHVRDLGRSSDDPKLNLPMELQPGDIQLVHNHTILHDRTAFEDYAEPERKRHLLRLWLAPEGARKLPEVFAERFGSTTPGERGGVGVAGPTLSVPLEF
ncbi:MAG TPA: TauD/TfdA family dioxygenase [Pyrinomonadaceae bacterium]